VKANRLVPYFTLALVVLILDQISKYAIKKNIDLYQTVSVIGDFFMLTYFRNRGAAFSILQNQRWLFVCITLVVVVGIVVYVRKSVARGGRLLPIALGLLLGGAIGNLIDRALYGEVVDFIQFHFVFTLFGKHVDYIYPIFNIADCGVVVGVIMILLDSLLKWRKEKAGHAHEGQLHDGQ
jgi:signal peptidase II